MNQRSVQGMAPAGVLRAAASYLAEHGWVQHNLYGSSRTCATPAACANGAIAFVVYGKAAWFVGEPDLKDLETPAWAAFQAAAAVLFRYLATQGVFDAEDAGGGEFGDMTSVAAWNDHGDRTAVQVIAGLHAAADQQDLITKRWLERVTNPWGCTSGGAA